MAKNELASQADDKNAGERSARRRSRSPLLLIVVAVALAAGAFMFLRGRTSAGSNNNKARGAPELFTVGASCPYTGQRARHHARMRALDAAAKMDRYPFVARDGVDAVNLLGESQACWIKVGDSERAAATAVAVADWRSRLIQRYQGHRLRLRRAMDAKRTEDALEEVGALRELLVREQDSDREWLDRIERRLESKRTRGGGS